MSPSSTHEDLQLEVTSCEQGFSFTLRLHGQVKLMAVAGTLSEVFDEVNEQRWLNVHPLRSKRSLKAQR